MADRLSEANIFWSIQPRPAISCHWLLELMILSRFAFLFDSSQQGCPKRTDIGFFHNTALIKETK